MSQQPSILVVDDEMGILDVLRILLKGEGFDVTTAQGGKAGLEALKGNPPDIVLTDIKMPGVSGTEILAAVRSEEHTSELQSRLHLVCRLLLEKKNNRPQETDFLGRQGEPIGA